MLRPTGDWQWLYDKNQQRLTLDLGSELIFVSHYEKKHLSSDAMISQGFSLEDMEYYLKLQQELEGISCGRNRAELTQIALNATAAHKFHRPIMPKSWFFKRSDVKVHFTRLVELNTEFNSALALVIEHEQGAVTCMLVDQELQLTDTKFMKSFDVIKVMPDCLEQFMPMDNAIQKSA